MGRCDLVPANRNSEVTHRILGYPMSPVVCGAQNIQTSRQFVTDRPVHYIDFWLWALGCTMLFAPTVHPPHLQHRKERNPSDERTGRSIAT